MQKPFEERLVVGLDHTCRKSYCARGKQGLGGRYDSNHCSDFGTGNAAVCVNKNSSAIFAKSILQAAIDSRANIVIGGYSQKQFRQVRARHKNNSSFALTIQSNRDRFALKIRFENFFCAGERDQCLVPLSHSADSVFLSNHISRTTAIAAIERPGAANGSCWTINNNVYSTLMIDRRLVRKRRRDHIFFDSEGKFGVFPIFQGLGIDWGGHSISARFPTACTAPAPDRTGLGRFPAGLAARLRPALS